MTIPAWVVPGYTIEYLAYSLNVEVDLRAIRAKGYRRLRYSERFVLLEAEALLMANYSTYASLNDPSAFGAALAAADESNDRHDAEFHR